MTISLDEISNTDVIEVPTMLEDLCGGFPERLTGPMVTEAAGAGDLVARQAFGQVGDWLGVGVANLVAAYDPAAVVIGGGNIYRGMNEVDTGIERAHGDYMGMLATVINGMALQAGLERIGVYTRLQSAIKMEQIAEPYIRRRAIRHLEKGRVVIFGAGTGNPYFTTDTAGSLRAIEINADVILKGTRVDGIYTADPEKDPTATKYNVVTFQECLSQNLKVMDMTAFSLAQENRIPLKIFNLTRAGGIEMALSNPDYGTYIYS